MKRIFCGIMVAILLLHCCMFALAEEEVLTIAVLYSSDAENLPAEEAFFKRYPNAVIEYRLYTEEQLNTMLMTGTAEFDLAILSYQNMLNMAKKGYLTSINEVLGQDKYPEQLVDWSNLLTIDDWIFALPVSVAQQFWVWDENVATKAGLSMPEGNMWTWEDYANYATKLPKDTDGDGIADAYLMYGSCLLEYPLFRKVNLNMFTQYTAHFTDFDVFGAQYLDLFKEVLTSDALLDMEDNSDAEVVLRVTSNDNPIYVLDGTLTVDSSGWRFLPPPLLDANDVAYAGTMSACGMLKQVGQKELATAFLQGMVSEERLKYCTFANAEQFISQKRPTYMYFDANGEFSPQFVEQNDAQVYRVSAGRNIPTISFLYSEEAYEKSQEFREKLSINTFMLGRDFYDSAWANFQEWYLGNINDAQLIQNMDYLFGVANGIR